MQFQEKYAISKDYLWGSRIVSLSNRRNVNQTEWGGYPPSPLVEKIRSVVFVKGLMTRYPLYTEILGKPQILNIISNLNIKKAAELKI